MIFVFSVSVVARGIEVLTRRSSNSSGATTVTCSPHLTLYRKPRTADDAPPALPDTNLAPLGPILSDRNLRITQTLANRFLHYTRICLLVTVHPLAITRLFFYVATRARILTESKAVRHACHFKFCKHARFKVRTVARGAVLRNTYKPEWRRSCGRCHESRSSYRT